MSISGIATQECRLNFRECVTEEIQAVKREKSFFVHAYIKLTLRDMFELFQTGFQDLPKDKLFCLNLSFPVDNIPLRLMFQVVFFYVFVCFYYCTAGTVSVMNVHF